MIRSLVYSALCVGGVGVATMASSGLAQPAPIVQQSGPYMHRFSGTEFPEELEGFRRVNIRQYDATGRDVGVNYERADATGLIYLTAYVYPSAKGRRAAQREELCRENHRESSSAIAERFPGARIVSEGPAPAIQEARPELALKSKHQFRTSFNGVEQDVQSELTLYCYVAEKWQLKYRVSAPVGANLDSVGAFMNKGPWPRGTKAPRIKPRATST